MNTPSYKEMVAAVELSGNFFQDEYLEYWNDYLTVSKFAEHREITDEEANQRINIGRKIHNQRTEA